MIPTSLGPQIVRGQGVAVLDLSSLPLFHGLSVLSRALGEMVVARAGADRVDVHVERQVRPRENPQLLRELGISRVKVSVEHDAAADIARHPDVFQDQLRGVLGTLQRQHYREILLPPARHESRALVFDFAPRQEALRHRCILEFVPSPRGEGDGYLRVTVETPEGRQLDLSTIPHEVVEDLGRRAYIAGSTRIAQTWNENIRREAERGHHSLVEFRQPHRHLFAQLDKAGLEAFREIHIHWTDAESRWILDSEPEELEHLLKRVLLTLEDREVRRLLREAVVIRIDQGERRVHLDVSHLGRVLNLSLGAARARVEIGHFLERMPTLSGGLADAGRPLEGIRVFLVHHITSEVIGLIAALRALGCRDLTCLFVAYAGEPPPDWLETLLDLPSGECRFLALAHVPDGESVEGHYKLSSQYSPIGDESRMNAALGRRRYRYFDAMRAVAALSFARQVAEAEAAGERCLIIEDGGYLAPRLNAACLAGETVGDFLREFDPEADDERPLREVLDDRLIGTVEHTRNGYNRLVTVERDFEALAFPAFTIAISRLKLEVESREVATSILNAVENVLHASGKILSRRRCLVLGSCGSIGRNLVHTLAQRLPDPSAQLAGVDLRVGPGVGSDAYPTAASYRALPAEARRSIDTVIGVTGESALDGEDLLEWLIEGTANELILASGSTKTEEFTDLMAFVDRLLADPNPKIGGHHCETAVQGLDDPMTGRSFGHRYRLAWDGGDGGRRTKELVFLANCTPVNFMFYGVPTELIEEVLAQLLGASLGLVRRSEEEAVRPGIYAVDHQITATGDPIPGG